jgi:hypothetical protein
LALKFRGKWEGKPVDGSIWAQGPHWNNVNCFWRE